MSEAIEPVSVQLECRALGKLGRPRNLIAGIEQEPAKADLLRGLGDGGGVAKVHEAFDETDSLLQEVAIVAHDRQRPGGVRTSFRQGRHGSGPIELGVLEDVPAVAVIAYVLGGANQADRDADGRKHTHGGQSLHARAEKRRDGQ